MMAPVIAQMRAIEAASKSRVLLLAVPQLELSLLPTLHEVLDSLGPQQRLDVILYGLGGIPNAARRIAMLLHDSTHHLTFVVPDRCESAATLLVTAGHQIIAGRVAIFTPIDPLLPVEGTAEGGPAGVAAEDIRLLPDTLSAWFGMDLDTARREALQMLGGAIFPSTLTSFHRATSEVEEIAIALTMLGAAVGDRGKALSIVEKLAHGFHSHGFALSGDDLALIGLPVVTDQSIERAAWQAFQSLRNRLDPLQRQDRETSHLDAVIATTDRCFTRSRDPATGAPLWTEGHPQ